MNQPKSFNKFQNVLYSYDKKLENINESDQSYLRYADDFIDMDIKSPELKKFKEDINQTNVINNSSNTIYLV